MGSNGRCLLGKVSGLSKGATPGEVLVEVLVSDRMRRLRSKPVVMVQSVQRGDGHQPATHRLRLTQRRVGIRYPVQPLMNAAVVIPEIEFGEGTPKMVFIPNQHSVETLSTKRPDETLDVRRCVGCAVRDRNTPNAHHLPQPHIECRSTRYPLPSTLHSQWTTELAELPVVVVDQEFGLFIETGVSDLLFRPFERRVLGHVEVDELSTRELHDDEHVEDTKPDRVLHKEVTSPHGLGLVLQEASPGLGVAGRAPFDHVSPDGRGGVSDAELHLQLQGDAILAVLAMIGGYPPNEVNMFFRNRRSAQPTLGLPPPELPKLPLSPSDHGLWFHEDQLGCPVTPNLGEQRPEQPIPIAQPRLPRLALVHGELLSERENPEPCHPVEPPEDNQIETLYDHEHK
jgi:hypothetical protein